MPRTRYCENIEIKLSVLSDSKSVNKLILYHLFDKILWLKNHARVPDIVKTLK
jgi:hypothetical protein